MSAQAITFLSALLLVAILVAWVARPFWAALLATAADHCRTYAVAYLKCGALMTGAAIGTWDETFKSLSPDLARGLPWWVWACFFGKPIGASLAVLVAFLDRSVQHASDARSGREKQPKTPVA